MGQENCHPEPGDLIEIDRGVYKHWAVYVGDGYVIRVTKPEEGAPSMLASTTSMFTSNAKVKKELLKEVVGKNKWCVNNKYDRSRTPLPVEQIIQRAEELIDKEVPYDVLGNNCEHFVTMLRYKKRVSHQVRKAVAGFFAAAGGIILAGLATAVVKILEAVTSKEEK